MRRDPALCPHAKISKSARIETLSVPQLGIEGLFLRVRVFCADCKEPFLPRTLHYGFSTEELGQVGEELLVPLDYPQADDSDEPEDAPGPSGVLPEGHPPKDQLH